MAHTHPKNRRAKIVISAKYREIFYFRAKRSSVKIAVNTRLLLKNKLEGIGRFSWEVLRRIALNHPEHEFIFIFDRPYHPDFIPAPNVKGVVLWPPARHPFLFVAWFEWAVYRFLKKEKPDLFLSPDGYLSLSTSTASLPVIHDLNFEHFPEDLPWLVRKYYRFFFPRFAKKARRIATVSNFSAADISKLYQYPLSSIDVVYNGVGEDFFRAPDEQIESFKAQYTQGQDFFLNVGSIHPRKNTVRMIKAFELFKSQNPSHRHKLVLVGDAYWWSDEMKQCLQQSKEKEDIVFTGRLPDAELAVALSAATALVYISYFEGFGIPMVEAMRCATPVLAANTSALPEVAADAALYADPFSTDDIAHKLAVLANDADLRMNLVNRGLEQSKKYTWDKAAERLWVSIEKALG